MKNWSKELYEPFLNTAFTITAADVGSIEVTLVEVKGQESGPVTSLSLLFKGPAEPILPHDTHEITHDKMGKFQLFAGPVIYHKQAFITKQSLVPLKNNKKTN
jgi:hypothetical protein